MAISSFLQRKIEETKNSVSPNTTVNNGAKVSDFLQNKIAEDKANRKQQEKNTSEPVSSLADIRQQATGRPGAAQALQQARAAALRNAMNNGAPAASLGEAAERLVGQTAQQPRDATLYDLTIGSIKRGYDNSAYGREAYKAMTGQENRMEEYAEKMAGEEYNFEPSNWLERGLSGAAELLGQQFKQWTDPAALALAGAAAGTAAIVGQAGPQIALPEEVITVPGAAIKGFTVGSAKAAMEVEAGHAYLEMIENGVSEDTAKLIASSVGGVNALLEVVQADELFKAFKALDKAGADEGVLKAITKELTDRGVDIAKETAQEVAQEGVTIAGAQIGSKMDNGEWAYDAEDVAGRLGDTALSSALSFGAMNVPAGVSNVVRQTAGGQETARQAAQKTTGGVLTPESTAAPPTAQNTPEQAVAREYGQEEATEPSRAARMDRSEGEKPGTGWSRFEAETEGSRASGAGEARQNETAAQSAAGEQSEYPDPRKAMNGGSGVDPDAAAAGDTDMGPRQERQVNIGFRDDAGGTDAKTAAYLDKLGKAAGVSIRMVDTGEVNGANGAYINGQVLISRDAEDPLRFVSQHEVTHRLQETAPEEYGRFRDYVRRIYRERGELKSQIGGTQALYREYGRELSEDEALDELAADYAGELMVDEAAIDRIVREDRGLAQRIWDTLKDWFNRIKSSLGGREARQLQQASRLWETALKRTYQSGAEPRTADAGSLWTAERMEEIGRSAGDIRRETGWSRDADGQWRHESDDVNYPLNGEPGRDTMEEMDSQEVIKNERERQRAESREAFHQRGAGRAGEGYTVFEGETAAYGYRTVGGVPAPAARQVSEEIEALGVDCAIIDGDVEWNHGGYTGSRKIRQASSIEGKLILISNTSDMDPRNVAGHEVFHCWKDRAARQEYVETLVDNILFTSPEFLHYQSAVANAYFGGEVDLTDAAKIAKLTEEIHAYISGDIHEGANDEHLRPMFRDYDAVKSAWERLVESQRETSDGKGQYSVRGSRELQREISRIVQEARSAGQSEEEVQARVRGAVDEAYRAMVEEYGAIEPGERPAREIQVPRRTEKDRKVSQTVRTILEAQATPEAALPTIRQMVAEGEFSYKAYSDKKALEDAESAIRAKGYPQAYADWARSVERGEVSKANTTMGWALYNAAVNSGDTRTAMDALTKMVGHQRNAAQALQATRILKKMSPEGQLYAAQRSVDDLVEELKKKYRDKAPTIRIDRGLAERFLKAGEQRARDEALREIYRDIGRQMPSRFQDKWNAWRYLAMLGNPRTHVRNIMGNAVFAPVVAVKNVGATAMETVYAAAKGGAAARTKAFLGREDAQLVRAALADYQTAVELDQGGGKYGELANADRYIEEGRRIFGNPLLERLRKANSAAMEAEDAWFARPHYGLALAQYCKANDISAEDLAAGTGLTEARAYAIQEAKKATYRDVNALSEFFSSVGRYRGDNIVKKGASRAVEGILPFRGTPANILARGLEYSPAGLLKTLTVDAWSLKHGEITTAEFFDHLSAGLTGSGLTALGVFMAAEGLVRGAGEGDREEREFDELQGHQTYALELGDTSVTLDWLAPECMPFFVGVNLYEQAQQETDGVTWTTITDSLSMITDPLLEMSCLQSLSDVFDSVGYASSNEMNPGVMALSSAATSYVTQALPTLLGQLERSGEGERMTTYTSKTGFWDTDTQYLLGKASSRIPRWDYQQIPYIDAWGRTEDTGEAGTRVFNNMLNPAYTSTLESSPMEEELERLYDATSERTVFPSRAPKYFNVDGERKDLTAEEYVEYAQFRGQSAYRILTDMTDSAEYREAADMDKVSIVSSVYEYSNALAKKAVSDYEPDGWVKKAMESVERTGIPEYLYIYLYEQQKVIEAIKDQDGDAIPNSRGLRMMRVVYGAGLTRAQELALFRDFGAGEKIIDYSAAEVDEALREMERAVRKK